MKWLNWSLTFLLDYALIHTWFLHTTHKSNVQWMPISFVWLYVFKCDLCMLNCLMIKFKKIFEYFMCFWNWFLPLWSLKFFSKCQIFSIEKLCFGHFTTGNRDCLREWFPIVKFLRNFHFLKISGREFHESLASASQLRLDSRISTLCICTFRE